MYSQLFFTPNLRHNHMNGVNFFNGVKMGTIAERITADGKIRYSAQIRINRKGLPPFIKTRTFSKESLAKEWIKRFEAEILINPSILNPELKIVSKTLAEFIKQYLDEIGNKFANTKSNVLLHITRILLKSMIS